MDDLISRQAAIDALEKAKAHDPFNRYEKQNIGLDWGIEAIKSLPSADRPQGEWIKHEHGFWTFVNDRGERDGWLPDYECNLCGSRAWRYASNYCPNCGADMRGEQDG